MEVDEDWEEWDRKRDKFWVHAAAGSAAGVMEHTLMFPVDTFKTMMQANRGRNSFRRALTDIRQLKRSSGMFRMWRGMPVTMAGCIPAHAMYFSVYESMKTSLRVDDPGHHPVEAAICGGVATMLHDIVMTPMDVVKQRLQLGYYRGVLDCVQRIASEEGVRGFLRSYPTTLGMNIPYAATVVATNESLKEWLNPDGTHDMRTYLLSGAGAGALAAAVTNPLDVVKTRLQTQNLASPVVPPSTDARAFSTSARPPVNVQVASFATQSRAAPVYTGFFDAVRKIYKAEGATGFMKGLRPRLLMHAPSMAISWGTYEFVKNALRDEPQP